MAAKVLVTGFRRFGPHAENPSETVVRRLASSPPRGVRTETAILPVDYAHAFAAVRERLDEGGVTAALHLGLAADRDALEFERFAINWRGGPSADEAGVLLEGEPIDPGGPAAYLASAPVDTLVRACRRAGAPVRTSHHAGTFLCNQVLYQTLRYADVRGLPVRVAFLHLPGPGDGRPDTGLLVRAVASAVRSLAALRPPTAPGTRTRTRATSRTLTRPMTRGPRRPERGSPRGGRP